MTRIGLISDTHGYLDDRIFHHLEDVDQIWHAGDVGSVEVIDKLRDHKTTIGVYGNIDDHKVRLEFPEFQRFECEEVKVLMTHIAGKPGKYYPEAHDALKKEAPQLFVCGHSHILMVKNDPNFDMLWMNPGACGIKGFHQVRTMLKFQIDGDRIENLQVIELGKRA